MADGSGVTKVYVDNLLYMPSAQSTPGRFAACVRLLDWMHKI